MLTSLSEMRSRALASLKGNWSAAVMLTMINLVITVLIQFVTGSTLFLSFLSVFSLIFTSTYSVALYRTHRGTDEYDNLFNLYFDLGDGKWWKYLLYPMIVYAPIVIGFIIICAIYLTAMSLMDSINIDMIFKAQTDIMAQLEFWKVLWPLMIIIIAAVIYIALAMALVPYIIFEHPELGAFETIRRSWHTMNGYKIKLLLLQLSFLGWGFLALLTCGFGFLWLNPYMTTAYAEFYLQVKAEHGDRGDQVVYEEDIEVVETEEVL